MTDKEKICKEVERLINELDTHHIVEPIQYYIIIGKKFILHELRRFIYSLPNEPASEDLNEAATLYVNDFIDGDIGLNPKILRNDCKISDATNELETVFKAGAKWQMNKLPKWRPTPIQGGCWSGEIGAKPTARLFVYEHYSINADKLFKLLNRED